MTAPSEAAPNAAPVFQQDSRSNRRLSDSHVTGQHANVQYSATNSMSATPRLGNLWQALKSVRIRTLFYSSVVAVIGSLSFGYANGFSSPTLPDLDKSRGEHTYFNRTIYHDLFNVSHRKIEHSHFYKLMKILEYRINCDLTHDDFSMWLSRPWQLLVD